MTTYSKALRYYIAGPMRGRISFNFPAFDEAERILTGLGHDPFSPATRDREQGFDPEGLLGTEDLSKLGFNLREALGDDLAFICHESDGICVLPEWWVSSGARAEVSVAKALGLPVVMIVFSADNTPSLKDITHTAYRLVSR